MADASGNDILAVGVPVTGFIGIAPAGTTIPTPAEGASPTLTLDPAFKRLGLLKTDGGPQFAYAADGEPIEFWQDGYSVVTGDANVTISVSIAEALNTVVRELIAGTTVDSNGYIEYDGGGHDTEYVVFTEEIFKNGAIRRRVCPAAKVQGVTEDQSNRGQVNGQQLVFEINRSAEVGGKHFGEWVLPAESGS
jgi:hypothetical protein